MDEDKILKKLVEQDGKFDTVLKKLVEHEDIAKLVGGQDQMITILQRLDQERVFTIARVERIEADVEKLKLQLHLA